MEYTHFKIGNRVVLKKSNDPSFTGIRNNEILEEKAIWLYSGIMGTIYSVNINTNFVLSVIWDNQKNLSLDPNSDEFEILPIEDMDIGNLIKTKSNLKYMNYSYLSEYIAKIENQINKMKVQILFLENTK
ncbi:MAG: hypothetical protein WC934_02105 [Acidithiobacillus sp.]|jgi:hypothetical protein|uniref:hypothetical protein n=1 Tax=Acidithiobacillus sp. TaxID=1872118 RepID=UPI00355F91F9